MRHFTINLSSQSPRILLLGAHCDDIEIGCGATVLQLAKRYPDAELLWVTLSADAQRAAETREAASLLTAGVARPTIRVEDFRGSYFPYEGERLKDFFEDVKTFEPHLILTHCRGDLHQDHRKVNELTWNTFRDHLIMEYEIPKFDGDLGTPNTYVPITRSELDRKCEILMQCFSSQLHRAWFTRDTFEAIARIRGIECNAPEGYAEAFFGRKIPLAL